MSKFHNSMHKKEEIYLITPAACFSLFLYFCTTSTTPATLLLSWCRDAQEDDFKNNTLTKFR